MLKNVMLGVGCRGGARDPAQRAHHHRRETVVPVYRQQVLPQASQRGEFHGALVARESVLVIVIALARGPLLAQLLRGRLLVTPIERLVAR